MNNSNKLIRCAKVVGLFLLLVSVSAEAPDSILGMELKKPFPKTTYLFRTDDAQLQKIFDEALQIALGNIRLMEDNTRVMVEGAQYQRLWVETQPMGGNMFARHDLEVAVNNQMIFIETQRGDGRLPGTVYLTKAGRFDCLQGCCFPIEAFEMYYWLEKDKGFLRLLYQCLEKYDAYLWRFRDSNNDGCLETWCAGDTGEDNTTRFAGGWSMHFWPYDVPPTTNNMVDEKIVGKIAAEKKADYFRNNGKNSFPQESMDIMSYSYTARDALSLISGELSNGKEMEWRRKADEVKKKIREYLWIPEKKACYDRGPDGKFVDILIHNNLRCMHFGSFDQEMADAFVKYHLLNPEEFWTATPLPSIAANDKFCERNNKSDNAWSGKPQGLTFQRSIRALENYGHYAELTMIGEKLLKIVSESGNKFTAGFLIDRAEADSANVQKGQVTYGPTILSCLEFMTRLYGIHITRGKILWSGVSRTKTVSCKQEWGERSYEMTRDGNWIICSFNGKEICRFTKGARVVTDLEGKFIELIGIDYLPVPVQLQCGGSAVSLTVEPNVIYRYNDSGKISEWKRVPFNYGGK